MPNLKEVRNRISSIKSTQKITKAMQMVAAAKLRRAREAAEASRPYVTQMAKVLGELTSSIGDKSNAPELLCGNGKDDIHLLLVCSAERGLCGSFSSSIARLAQEHARNLLSQGKKVKILCAGKKGYNILRRRFPDYMEDLIDLRGIKKITFKDGYEIAKRLLDMFERGEFDVCTLFFSQFKSVIIQIPTKIQIIPAQSDNIPDNAKRASAKDTTPPVPYEYEPEEELVLADLLPRNINIQIFRALVENAASEQGARMTAMDSATRNATEMIDDLSLTYNRTRQAMITRELIEIISGAAAL